MGSHLFLLLKSYPKSIHNRKKISTKIIHIKNKKKAMFFKKNTENKRKILLFDKLSTYPPLRIRIIIRRIYY